MGEKDYIRFSFFFPIIKIYLEARNSFKILSNLTFSE